MNKSHKGGCSPSSTSGKTNPTHYQFDGVQVIDITQHLDFLLGNVVKYAARAGRKTGESKIDDLLKAEFYLKRAIENDQRKG
jgi:hypothetical protein